MLFSLGGPMTKEILYRILQHRRPVLHNVFKRDNVCSSILKCFLFLFALFVVCWRETTFPLTGYWDSVLYVWGRHFWNKCYIKFLMMERVFRVFQHFYYKMKLPEIYSKERRIMSVNFLLLTQSYIQDNPFLRFSNSSCGILREIHGIYNWFHDIGVRYGLLRAWHSMPRKPGLVSRRHLD